MFRIRLRFLILLMFRVFNRTSDLPFHSSVWPREEVHFILVKRSEGAKGREGRGVSDFKLKITFTFTSSSPFKL